MENYTTHNSKLIIKQLNLTTTLNNGIVIQETRGKKDILVGEVILTSPELDIKKGDWVWFPEYASLPIALDNQSYYVIDYQDVILSKEKEK